MGIALMVVIAGSLAVGCASKQQKAAASEKKLAQQQAKAEQKRQQQEAKRLAALEKSRYEEDRRLAEKHRKEQAKYEREQREAIGSDFIRDERLVRSVDRFAQGTAAAGAREDAMLNDSHFDGGELNALGRSKVALIARSAEGSKQPVAIYVGGVDEAASQPRIAAVQSYLQASPHADLKLELKPGFSDTPLTPASSGIAGLAKMDKQNASSSSGANGAGTGSGSSGGSSTR
jgi:hypothetical protein